MGIVQRERPGDWTFGELCLKWLPISFNTEDKKVKMIHWEKRARVKRPEVWTLGRKRLEECRNRNLWPSDVQEPLVPADVSISPQPYIQRYLGSNLKSATPWSSTTVTNQALSSPLPRPSESWLLNLDQQHHCSEHIVTLPIFFFSRGDNKH